MLRFVLFEGDAPDRAPAIRHAHLVGPDDVPVSGDIRQADGIVECAKTNREAAALSLQVDLEAVPCPEDPSLELGPAGVLTLQTCLLPEREAPYMLSLELARHRLMLLFYKLEEWQLFDLPADYPAMRLFDRAREAFTSALVAQRGPRDGGTLTVHGFCAEANRRALWSLRLAVEAGERFAIETARRDFGPRMDGTLHVRAAAESPDGPEDQRGGAVRGSSRPGVVLAMKPAVGCAVAPGVCTDEAQDLAAASCDFITMPMRWVEMEPTEGGYSFAQTDRWIEWAVRRARLPVVAGPVIDFRPPCVPEWLYIWENDYETLRELVYEHVKSIVTRYRRTIARWTVVSGLHTGAAFNLTFDQMMDLTRICVMVVRKLHSAAKVQVELTQPWGEYYTRNRRSLPPTLYAEMLAQAGINVDAISLRIQMGQPEPGQSVRDLMAFSAMLDRYAALEKPVTVSAIGVPSAAPETDGVPELAGQSPGYWRRPWSDETQADWMTAAMSIALAKPFVQAVCWQELCDQEHSPEMPAGGIVRPGGGAKPAAARLRALRDAVRAGRVPDNLDPDTLLGALPDPLYSAPAARPS